MKKCAKCGKNILDQTKICPYCSWEQQLNLNENEVRKSRCIGRVIMCFRILLTERHGWGQLI